MYEIIFFIHHFLFRKKKKHISQTRSGLQHVGYQTVAKAISIRSRPLADVAAELALDFAESQSDFRKHTQDIMPI